MLGEKLKNARKESGYSQDEVAEKLQITRQAVSKWENDRNIPDVETLVKLSDLYGVSLDRLMRGKAAGELRKKNETDKEKESNLLQACVVLVVSCMLPILGLVVSAGILMYCKKKRLGPKWLVGLAILCLSINLCNIVIFLNDILEHIGGNAMIF